MKKILSNYYDYDRIEFRTGLFNPVENFEKYIEEVKCVLMHFRFCWQMLFNRLPSFLIIHRTKLLPSFFKTLIQLELPHVSPKSASSILLFLKNKSCIKNNTSSSLSKVNSV